ncbi:MAG TPA: VOC family protein [Polyangia bacterium]|nr:VOC family protein [Polyangia bacterium]
MKLTHTTLFVPEIARALVFYEEAFGMKAKLVHVGGQYAELEAGGTTLAFAAHALARGIVGRAYVEATRGGPPLGVELALEPDDVAAAFARAVAAGAEPVSPPEAKPWGQLVAYVRDLNGFLISLAREL